MQHIVRQLWSYRGFIVGSIMREFQSKYRNTLLGAAWNLIQPLSMIIVYTVVFSEVMRAKLPGVDGTFAFSIFLCAGLLTWGLFSEIVMRSQTMFLDHANLIKKVNFPKVCIPFTIIANALVNFAIVFSLFTFFLIISGNWPGITYVAIFPIMVLLLILAVGLGIILGVLNVFFRDVGQFFSIFITFWFWLTPIVYPVSILPARIQATLDWNPMVSVVTSIQAIVVNGQWPQWQSLGYPLVLGMASCVLGVRLFRNRHGEMLDEL